MYLDIRPDISFSIFDLPKIGMCFDPIFWPLKGPKGGSRGSMVYLPTLHECLIFMVNVGKYTKQLILWVGSCK